MNTFLQQANEELIQTIPQYSRVVVGLSGGVDSAVSAYLLKAAGYDVVGMFLQCYQKEAGCTVEEDFFEALKVARHLDIRLMRLDLIKEYKTKVLDLFYSEYKAGRTPNPDVLCNTEIKFKLFLEKALEESGADFFATGHYARKVKNEKLEINNLVKGKDDGKDQSYFLYRISQDALDRAVFPLGSLTKEQVRTIAKESGLPNADRPDSTGICFIGDVSLIDFLKKELPEKQGDVLNKSGEKVGTHRGAWFYTIGQRHGFETSLIDPVYVLYKDTAKNTLIVGTYDETFSSQIKVNDVTWRSGCAIDSLVGASVRVRNLGEFYEIDNYKYDNDELLLQTKQPIQAPAPGQTAVFYDASGVVLGGGVIVDGYLMVD